eukprot:Nitzschia sp. Nitz4//scaffold187_size43274//5079//6095//NITZ4_007329-RA/size43274-exonerate_protein2genome-gene-0.15-mRNA-1//1//CDS//3329539795//5179//frame0
MNADNGISYLNASSSICTWNNRLAGSDDPKGVFCTDALPYGALTYLDLHASNLIGNIPWEISLLEDLETLKLEDNALSGTLSSQLAHMSSLKNFWLQSNQMTGTIPSEYGSLSQLIWLDLEDTQLTGTIPTQLGTLSKMERLYLEGNSLSGTLPAELGDLTQLRYFYIYGNSDVTGTVPSTYSQLHQLESFLFHNTSLIGTVDSIFCTLPDRGFPSTMWADCLGEEPEMECTCCDVCCSAEGGNCRANVGKSEDDTISLTPPTRFLRSQVSFDYEPSTVLPVSHSKMAVPP